MAGTDAPIDEIVAQRAIETVFQPIVDIDTGSPVAYEALARGPRGSSLERPDQLFAAAEVAGRTSELDWACRGVAVRSAVEAGLRSPARLFVNVEPRSFGTAPPADVLSDLTMADGRLDIVVEVTERALAADPAAMLESLRRARERGDAIAIDDVGAHPASLALMPVIEPDVIKLDLRLVQQRSHPDVSEISRAVMAQAERTGALIVAEGVETEAHLAQARVLGAHLAQGWLFGRPGPLPATTVSAVPFLDPIRLLPIPSTPFAALPPELPTRVASKALLLPMSHHLEASVLRASAPPIIAATFQDARHFTPATARRYVELGARSSFALAVGADLPSTPAAGVRGATIRRGHDLEGEWVVAILGPHDAAALVARDLADTGPDRDRRFAYAITHDRDVVLQVVRSLLRYVDAELGQ